MEYRELSLDGWKEIGAGGNGKTYANPEMPDKLLKINNGKLGRLDFVKREYDLAAAVTSLGIQTPAVYEIVKVGGAYGTIFQKISGKKSFSRLCADEPSRIPEMAALFVEKAKELHSTPCDATKFPSRKQQAIGGALHFPALKKQEREKLLAFANGLQEPVTCLHGDFQYGNIITAGGQNWWIDLGRFAYGDPMFDVGHLYMLTGQHSNSFVRKITHLTEEQARLFWDCFAKGYTGSDDPAVLSEFTLAAKRYSALDIFVRQFLQPSLLIALLEAPTLKKIIREAF